MLSRPRLQFGREAKRSRAYGIQGICLTVIINPSHEANLGVCGRCRDCDSCCRKPFKKVRNITAPYRRVACKADVRYWHKAAPLYTARVRYWG